MEIPTKNLDTNGKKRNSFLYPLIAIIAFIPLLVRQKICDTNLENLPWFSSTAQTNDFFLYYKSLALLVLTFVMAIILIFNISKIKKKSDFPIFMIPLGIYGLLVILSMILSENRSLSLNGSIEQFESGIILLGYVVFTYYTYVMLSSTEDITFLIQCWAVSIGILVLLGFSQILNHDFFGTNLGKHLITMKQYWDNLDGLTFTMGAKRVYLTLYNPNYVGVYASLAIPILAVLLIFNHNKVWKVIYATLIVGMLVCVVGSASKSAFISLAIVLLLFLLFMRKKLLKNWKLSAIFLAVLVVAFFIFDASTNHLYTTSLKDAFQGFGTKTEYPLRSIQTGDDKISIDWNGNVLNLTCDLDRYTVGIQDQDGNPVITQMGEDNLETILDERFAGITVMPVLLSEQFAVQVSIQGDVWYFAPLENDGKLSYYYYNPFKKWDKIAQPETVSLPEHIMSNRGYIWSRTIPLLKDYFIVGSGPDTFVQVFPGNDYVGMANNGFKGSVMTKPHNMYLQTGVQTGVLSLLAFLAFYLIYFVESVKLYFKNTLATQEAQLGVGIFLGTIGYMIAGLSNDSTITVAPIFWILMGAGFWLNKQVKNQATDN